MFFFIKKCYVNNICLYTINIDKLKVLTKLLVVIMVIFKNICVIIMFVGIKENIPV